MAPATGLDPSEFTKLYLDGKYVPAISKETFSLKNPKDGSVVVDGVPIAGAEDVDLAVKYAEEAFNGPWSTFTALQRTECLHRLAKLMEDNLLDILTLDSLTGGNPVSLIPTREKTYIKNCIMYFSGWTDKLKGDYYPADDGMWRRFSPAGDHLLTRKFRIHQDCAPRADRCMCGDQPIQRACSYHDAQSGTSPRHW